VTAVITTAVLIVILVLLVLVAIVMHGQGLVCLYLRTLLQDVWLDQEHPLLREGGRTSLGLGVVMAGTRKQRQPTKHTGTQMTAMTTRKD
jgi:hypothetical protein